MFVYVLPDMTLMRMGIVCPVQSCLTSVAKHILMIPWGNAEILIGYKKRSQEKKRKNI